MSSIDTSTPEGLAWIRDAMKPGGLFGFTTYDFPEVREIPGPAGPIPIRIMTPETVNGVYLHYHGGGMTMGSALSMDARNWQIAEACSVVVVSVDYRLAPEHPFPAGPDDCEAAALWLIDNAQAEFGTDRLLVGGESAGAYFSLLTMVRLRDRLGGTPPFAGDRPLLRRVRPRRHAEHHPADRQGSVRDRRRHQPQALPAGAQHRGVPRSGDLAAVGAAARPAARAHHRRHRRLAAGRLALPRRPAGGRRLTGRARGLPGRSARHRVGADGARQDGPRPAARVPAGAGRASGRHPDHGALVRALADAPAGAGDLDAEGQLAAVDLAAVRR